MPPKGGFTFMIIFAIMKPMQNINNKEEIDAVDNRVYELGFLFVPTIKEEELPVAYDSLKELVASFGGQTISDEMPRMMNLAYSMVKVVKNVRSKFDTAYFGWVKFTMDADKVLSLKKKLDLDPNVIRFLILKTVKENTIASKRFTGRDMTRRKAPVIKTEGENVEPAEINKEDIDKEIDAMIAV